MKEIAILGGAFNPPTKMHLSIANLILSAEDLHVDEVWIMPCYGHMFGKKMEDPWHRLAMCQIMIESKDPRIKISNFEIQNRMDGSVYNLFGELKEQYSTDFKFSFIIGQDNTNNFKRWEHWEYLVSNAKFIIIPRQGYFKMKFKNEWYNPNSPSGGRGRRHRFFVEWGEGLALTFTDTHGPVSPIFPPIAEGSSTEAREEILKAVVEFNCNGKTSLLGINKFLPDPVFDYISANKLYRKDIYNH